MRTSKILIGAAIFFGALLMASFAEANMLGWEELPPLPNPEGVAGPFVGVHNDALIIAGGANFPDKPRWETDKVWHASIYVLEQNGKSYEWHEADPLPKSIAYGAAVSTPDGVLCMGGSDGKDTFSEVFLMQWDPSAKTITYTPYPSLPKQCAFTSAALLDGKVYLAGGMSGSELTTAMNNFWMLDLAQKDSPAEFQWQELPAWPGPPRAINITATQHDGFYDGIYVMSGEG